MFGGMERGAVLIAVIFHMRQGGIARQPESSIRHKYASDKFVVECKYFHKETKIDRNMSAQEGRSNEEAATSSASLAITLSPIAEAKKSSSHPYTQQAEPNEADLDSHGRYKKTVATLIRERNASQAKYQIDSATAQCHGGSYSFSKHRSGTCSRHGGVAQ